MASGDGTACADPMINKVTSSDILSINGRIGQAANASNFKYDVNVSGNTSSTDTNTVKAQTGQTLP